MMRHLCRIAYQTNRPPEKNFFLGLLLFCLLLPGLLFPLDPRKKISQNLLDVWGIEEGLPQSTVYSIITTREGFLCVGTEEGVVRFDGVQFKVYDKKNVEQLFRLYCRYLYEDRAGNLWIGTYVLSRSSSARSSFSTAG